MATENKNLSHYNKSSLPDAKPLRFGIVVSEWNSSITEALYKGAQETLTGCGALQENIIYWTVPGSFEPVYGSKKMLQTQRVDAVIAIGCIIRGETPHFDVICAATAQGIGALNVMFNVPVIFCVLTDETMQQAIDRSGGKHGNKGIEAAIAAIKIAAL